MGDEIKTTAVKWLASPHRILSYEYMALEVKVSMCRIQVQYGAGEINLVSAQGLQEGGNDRGRQEVLAPKGLIVAGLFIA